MFSIKDLFTKLCESIESQKVRKWWLCEWCAMSLAKMVFGVLKEVFLHNFSVIDWNPLGWALQGG